MSEELKVRLEKKLADVVGCGIDEADGIIEEIWPLIAAALPASAIPEGPPEKLVNFILDALESDSTKKQREQAFEMLRNWFDRQPPAQTQVVERLRVITALEKWADYKQNKTMVTQAEADQWA